MEQLEQFIDQLITEKNLSGMSAEARVALKTQLTELLMDQIDRSMIDALSEEQAIELSQKLDNPNFSDADMTAFLQASGVDMQQVTLDTMLKFREFYLKQPTAASSEVLSNPTTSAVKPGAQNA